MKKILLLTLCAVYSLSSYCQLPVLIGDAEEQRINDFLIDNSGPTTSLYFYGNQYVSSTNSSPFLTKTDITGTSVDWTINLTNVGAARDMVLANNGDVVLLSGGDVLFVSRVNSSGSVLWSERYSVPNSEGGNFRVGSLVASANDNFIVNVIYDDGDPEDNVVFEINSTGVMQWHRKISLENHAVIDSDEHNYRCTTNNNNGILVYGYADNTVPTFFELDSQGDLVADQSYAFTIDGDANGFIQEVLINSFGNYVFLVIGRDNEEIVLFEMNPSNRNILWSRRFQMNQHAAYGSVVEFNSSYYAAFQDHINQDSYIAELNTSGQLLNTWMLDNQIQCKPFLKEDGNSLFFVDNIDIAGNVELLLEPESSFMTNPCNFNIDSILSDTVVIMVDTISYDNTHFDITTVNHIAIVDTLFFGDSVLCCPTITATNSVNGISCFGSSDGSVSVMASSGTTPYTYTLNGQTNSTGQFNNLGTGSYTVDIVDGLGCAGTHTFTIAGPLPLSSGILATDVSCFQACDGSLDLSVTGGTTPMSYSWSNGETTADINGLCAGMYSVTITDANGCNTSNSSTITEPTIMTSGITGVNATCFQGCDGSIDLSVNGGITPYSYIWSNGATAQDLDNLCAGNYTVTVTDANGCEIVETFIISEPSELISSILSSNISCPQMCDGNIDLSVSGGMPPYSYQWSNGETTQDLNNLCVSNYFVVITDANGCQVNNAATIFQPTEINILGIVTPETCIMMNGQIDVTVFGGTPPYSYSWSGPNSFSSSLADLSNLIGGIYNLTVTDDNGCVNSRSFEIVPPVNCCFAASDPAFFNLVEDENSSTQHVFGNLIDPSDDLNSDQIVVLNGKYYIQETVTIENVVLDVTNCDLVFDDCAELLFKGNAKLIANNSVFRPCESTSFWNGITLDGVADNEVRECTFKNAAIALNVINESTCVILENTFSNCNVGAKFEQTINPFPITSNSFVFDESMPVSTDCDFRLSNKIGITIISSSITGSISNNGFINNISNPEFSVVGISSFASHMSVVSENSFSDFQHAIAVFKEWKNAEDITSIENNEMQISFENDLGSAQIQLISTNNILINGNEIVSNNMEVDEEKYVGIELAEACSNIEINNNKIDGFTNGILIKNSGFVNITNNIIQTCDISAIATWNSNNVYIGCNEIELELGNDRVAGVAVLDKNLNIDIFSNCIRNAQNSIVLYSSIGARDGRSIDIRNNFLYNYQLAGIYNDGFNNLTVGTTEIPGQNTFWNNMNMLQGFTYGWDIISYTSMNVSGNFGIQFVSPWVTQQGNNQFHSIASCSSQIEETISGSYIDQNVINCNNKNFELFQKNVLFDEISDYSDEYFKYRTVLSYYQRLKLENPSHAFDFVDETITNSVLNSYYELVLKYNVEMDNEDYLNASNTIAYLKSIASLDQLEILNLDDIFTKIEMGTLELSNLQNSDLQTINSLASHDNSFSNITRSVLVNYYSRNNFYVNHIDLPKFESTDISSIEVGQDLLQVYPNPASDLIEITISLKDIETAKLMIYNVAGQVIKSVNIDFVLGKTTVNVSELSSGVYFLAIQDGKNINSVEKLIKK